MAPQYSKPWPPQNSKPSYAYVKGMLKRSIHVFPQITLCKNRKVVQIMVAEKTPREKTKRRKDKKSHAKRQKDKITPCKKTKPATRKEEISARKDEKAPCKKNHLKLKVCHLFAWRLFVFSHGVFSSFLVALFRLVVFSHDILSSFRGEK